MFVRLSKTVVCMLVGLLTIHFHIDKRFSSYRWWQPRKRKLLSWAWNEKMV